MTTKTYTSINNFYTSYEQSKMLKNFLKEELADLSWIQIYDESSIRSFRIEIIKSTECRHNHIPAWSFSALVGILSSLGYTVIVEPDGRVVCSNKEGVQTLSSSSGSLVDKIVEIIKHLCSAGVFNV